MFEKLYIYIGNDVFLFWQVVVGGQAAEHQQQGSPLRKYSPRGALGGAYYRRIYLDLRVRPPAPAASENLDFVQNHFLWEFEK